MKRTAALLLIAILTLAAPAKEESKLEKQKKAEAEQAAQEDALAAKMDGETRSPLLYFEAQGTLSLATAVDEKMPEVVGEFATSGKTFLVKLANPDLLKDLRPSNGKTISLVGKLRNEGKYFIVSHITGGGPPPVSKTNRKRI